MPRRESEGGYPAPPPPGFTTPTKAIRNDGASHADPDAEETEAEFESKAQKEF
jgi:hypothetical protein